MKKIYQKLYETTNYGDAKIGRCPEYRHIHIYQSWVKEPIASLGCGRGDTVEWFRVRGYDIDGYDFINLKNGMFVQDITKPFDLKRYKTVICFDVLEHLTDQELKGLFKNLKQVEDIIVSVSNTQSIDWGTIDLHVNKSR